MDNSQLPPVIGHLSAREAAEKLREIGEITLAEQLDTLDERHDASRPTSFTNAGNWKWPFRDKPWQHTAHAFGYVAGGEPTTELLTIKHAGNISPDLSLKKARLKITLNRLRVASYPGGGTHRVLLDFYGQNQIQGGTEDIHFNATYRVREGEQAGVIGYPIFLGLHVGNEGISFRCYTVNVRNDDDESFLSFLESDTFRAGLKLASTAQPAIAPLSGLALAVTKSIARRHRNVPVQDFYMGLDFSNNPLGARLAEGAFIAVQIPEALETVWDWSEWAYNPNSGHVVKRTDLSYTVPYNYIIFGVTRYSED